MRPSQLITLASGSPSAEPTSTSDWMPRIVPVIGAHVERGEHLDRGIPREHADGPTVGRWSEVGPDDVAAGYHSGAVRAARRLALATSAGS